MVSEQSKGEIGGKIGRPSRRSWSIVIAIAVSAMLLLVFILIALDHPNGTLTISPTRKKAIPYGFEFDLTGPSSHVSWTDVTIQLSSGIDTISWSNLTAEDLNSNEMNATWHYGHPQILGPMSVWLNVTDLAGNGCVDTGDHVSFTTSSSARFLTNTTYTIVLLYEPTGGSMLDIDFTG